ncbi:MAG TPA: shikimate kinase [Acidimicrobiales bacterium]|nr:shikimate kinase [Acidimicrobiales bacterium]
MVLVGLMGSGKTTVGRRLAALLDRAFVDADDAVEARAGRPIAEIFEDDGEDAFRDLEAAVLEELLRAPDHPVIASGGGAVVRPATRALLGGDDVTVVWLDAAPAFLASRIERKAHRPLLAGDETPRQVLERLHGERAPLYAEVADLVVEVEPFHREEERPKQALAVRIADLLEQRGVR